jgi:hypothetical protein
LLVRVPYIRLESKQIIERHPSQRCLNRDRRIGAIGVEQYRHRNRDQALQVLLMRVRNHTKEPSRTERRTCARSSRGATSEG